MPNKRITSTDILNAQTEHFLYKRFELLALNQFEWEGLPETIQERHIEQILFSNGYAVFFEDPELGFLCLPASFGEGLNVYGDPLTYRVSGHNYTRFVKASDSVLIENNKLRMPTILAINYFVSQLYEIVRARDVNIKTLKLPFLISCNDTQLFTFKKVLEEIDKNNYAIYGEKSYELQDSIKVLPTGAKCLTAELTDLYHDCLNEALTYLGINNANTDKRERLITSEANANNQLIDSCANMFLEARQRAADAISKMIGNPVNVRIRNPRPEAMEDSEGDQENAKIDN